MKNVKYIFCIVFCLGMMNGVMAQNSTDLPALEKQLCFIQDTLYTLRQNYSFLYCFVYVSGEIEVYKLERNKGEIKFISSGKDGHL